ncbi:MAG TPA: hypothetical protein VEY30_05910 [Myxococcaceae bacterium]|nr:hypothetical protein [Myxococcaceae bacterium]
MTRTYTFAERIMLQHAHPAKLTLDCIGIALAAYWLWLHRLPPALVSLFGLSILGNVVVWKADVERLSGTRLGRWMLGQAHPFNLVTRTVGAVIVAYGLWAHSALYLLGGVLVIVAARRLSVRSRR